MDMTWGRLILLSLGKMRPKNTFQAQVVPTTGDGARAPWLQQHSIGTFFGTPCIYMSRCMVIKSNGLYV